MQLKRSVTTKLVLSTSGGIFIIMVVAAFFIVKSIKGVTSKQVNKEIESMMALHARSIESYFHEHAVRTKTIFRNDLFLSWMKQHRQRGEQLDSPEYKKVHEFFDRESKYNSAISAVFFGSKYTGEYFYQRGIFKADSYDVTTRPWWQKVRDTDSWTVTNVSYEPDTDDFLCGF